jgi:hypothetical protein
MKGIPLYQRLLGPSRGAFEFYFRPGIRTGSLGPFNGQAFRRRLFLQLLGMLDFKAIVETGTFRAETTEYMAVTSRVPLHTVERNPRLFHYAKRRLRLCRNVTPVSGDSRVFLSDLTRNPRMPKEEVFFYLDAHWRADLPLHDEFAIILRAWRRFVVMIDDFAVPGDTGYGFDDYGPGRSLCIEYLADLLGSHVDVFFPSAPSSDETGARRGCVVLADPVLRSGMLSIPLLRWHHLSAEV